VKIIEQIRQFIQAALVWLGRVVTQPRSELDRWQRAALFTYDLSRFGTRQLRQDRAPQMAAALSFRVLFGLLPVLIVVTIVVRSLIGIEEFWSKIDPILDDIGLGKIQVVEPTNGKPLPEPSITDSPADSSTEIALAEQGGEAAEDAALIVPTPKAMFAEEGLDQEEANPKQAAVDETAAEKDAAAASGSLKLWIRELIEQAAGINPAALGTFGFALIVYAAISLMVTIENSFNTIYRAPEGRSWAKRVPMYWFVLTISPAILVLAAFLESRLANALPSLDGWVWLGNLGGFLWVVCIEWLFMFSVYTLVPNTEVKAQPAAIGAAVTVLLMEIGKRTMGVYLSHAFTISHLYGTLGLVPLFMFWVYLMWLGVLFGLQVSATLQMLHGRRLNEVQRKREQIGLIDPASVLTVMEIVTTKFNQGQSTSAQEIAEAALLPSGVVTQIFKRLIEAGMLHELDHDDQTVTLAKPAEQISADQLIDIGYAMADGAGDGHRSSLLERLRETQRNLAAQVTLASLVPSASAPPPAKQ